MNEEMRKDFEEWWKIERKYWRAPLGTDDMIKEAMLAGYEASREAMKPIKLPKSEYVYHVAQHEMTAVIDLNECREAIKLAGYKVEE